LGDGKKLGSPKNITIYNPKKYLGSRDTEPRYVILSRQKVKSLYTNLICCHLTTLVSERLNINTPYKKLSANAKIALQEKKEEAELLRVNQAQQIIRTVEKYFKENNSVMFLAGDFNAIKSEPAIESILVGKANFKLLIPENDRVHTHIEAETPIDHIFVYPANRLVDYKCWIIDSKLADAASDHRPIVADIKIN
jgi:endonuclease/exonuclease/phosphatase family metal-dependent hydrolase